MQPGPAPLLLLLLVIASSQQEDCYCSGLPGVQCSLVAAHWVELVVGAGPGPGGFSLSDRDPATWLGRNKPVWLPATRQLTYRYRPGDTTHFYWALPASLLGNQLAAYGGNLSVEQAGAGRGGPWGGADTAVLVGGNLTLHHSLAGPGPGVTRLHMVETAWHRLQDGRSLPVTAAEFLTALADLDSLHVPVAAGWAEMEWVGVAGASLDVRVVQCTAVVLQNCTMAAGAGPGSGPARHAAQLPLPARLRGGLVRALQPGSLQGGTPLRGGSTAGQRNHSKTATIVSSLFCDPLQRCPCEAERGSCTGEQGKPVCLCRPGWVGEFCAQRPIAVNIAGPPVLSARPGQTVQFDCSGEPQIRIQEAMEFSWSREDTAMPDRAADSGFGLLGEI